jgi:hypothetical protein
VSEKVDVSMVAFGGWPNCYKISDGQVEAIVTTDVGPRVIYLGFTGGKNLFAEFEEQMGKTNDEQWLIFGGHRLWHSPETWGRCYHPDSVPVKALELPNGVHLIQPVEPNTNIEKEIIITLNPGSHQFTVEHRMTNRGNWPVNFALWGLSVMKPGGTAILPQYRVADVEGLLPNRTLELWPYTDMSDSRATWGSRYILISQDAQKPEPFKIGLTVPEGWAAYAVDGVLFQKKFAYDPAATYPDAGVNVELYTNDRMLELETLSPLRIVAPGATATHTETWILGQGLGQIKTEADVESQVIPILK